MTYIYGSIWSGLEADERRNVKGYQATSKL